MADKLTFVITLTDDLTDMNEPVLLIGQKSLDLDGKNIGDKLPINETNLQNLEIKELIKLESQIPIQSLDSFETSTSSYPLTLIYNEESGNKALLTRAYFSISKKEKDNSFQFSDIQSEVFEVVDLSNLENKSILAKITPEFIEKMKNLTLTLTDCIENECTEKKTEKTISDSTPNSEKKDVTELFKEVLTLFIKLTNKKLNIANLKKFLAFNENSYKQALEKLKNSQDKKNIVDAKIKNIESLSRFYNKNQEIINNLWKNVDFTKMKQYESEKTAEKDSKIGTVKDDLMTYTENNQTITDEFFEGDNAPYKGENGNYNVKLKQFSDYLYRFKNKQPMFTKDNDQKAETMNFLIDVIDSHIDNILKFNKANIVKQLQGMENATAINIMTRDLMKTNILTFIKIRNDQHQEGVNNARFNIELDEGGNKQKHMLLQYNDDNEKYYEQDVTSSEGKGFNVAKDLIDNDKFKQDGNNIQVSKYDRKYIFGEFTQIFKPEMNNQDISKQMKVVTDQLISGKNVFIMGYGASGAGKTSTLIYFNQKKENGILIELCNIVASNSTPKYEYLEIDFREFYNSDMCDTGKENKENECEIAPDNSIDSGRGKNKTDNPVKPSGEDVAKFTFSSNEFHLQGDYTHTNEHPFRVEKLVTDELEELKKKENNNTITDLETKQSEQLKDVITGDYKSKTFTKGTKLGDFVRYLIDDDRHVKATTNNPNSSRSHSLIFVKFKQSEESDGPTLIVGDFAGVENEFDCENEKVKEDFMNIRSDRNINEYFYKKEVKGDILDPIGQLKTSNNNQNSSNDDEKQLYINPLEEQKGGGEGTNDDELPLFEPENIEINFEINKDKWIKDGKYTVLSDFDSKDYEKIVTVFLDKRENKDYYKELMEQFKSYYSVYQITNSNQRTLTFNDENSLTKKHIEAKDNLNGIDDLKKKYHDAIEGLKELVTSVFTSSTKGKVVTGRFKPALNILVGNDYNENKYKQKIMEEFSKILEWPEALDKPSNWNNEWLKKEVEKYYNPTEFGDKLKDLQLPRKDSLFPEFGVNNTAFKEKANSTDAKSHSFYKHIVNNVLETPPSSEKAESNVIDTWTALTESANLFLNAFKFDSKEILINVQIKNQKGKKKVQPQKKEITYSGYVTPIDKIKLYKDKVFPTGEPSKENSLKFFIDKMLASRKRRLEIGDTICKHRRTEGYFINDSLKDIRSAIRDMLYEKNKDALSIVPNYVDICFDKYCPNHENCFAFDKKITKVDKTSFTGSVIFDEIFKKLNPKADEKNKTALLSELYKNLLVGVFCVVNVSKKASNPPPVPYIDINELKRIVYYNEAKDIIDTDKITKKFVNESLKLINTIENKYIDKDPETEKEKNKVQDIIDAKLKQDIEAPVYDQFQFINNDNKQKTELISTNYNLFKMIVYHLLKKSGFEDSDQKVGGGENELPEYANKFIEKNIKNPNEDKIKGLIELDLMRLNALYGWATTPKELKQKQYLGSQYQNNVGYGLMTLEGDKQWDPVNKKFGQMKKKITPSIDIYITHVHDEFIEKYIEVFELVDKIKGFNKENLINTLNINQGYHHMATVIKESIKAYMETNKDTAKLLYPDSNAFIRIFLSPQDNENKSYVSQYDIKSDGIEKPRSPILRIVDAYVDIENIFKKENVRLIRKNKASYLNNFNKKIEEVQNKNEESKATEVNKGDIDNLEYEEKTSEGTYEDLLKSDIDVKEGEEQPTVQQLEDELMALIKKQEENSYSDSFHPKTKDDFVRNLPEDAYYTNLEVYYKIKEKYTDEDWNKKKQEIINKRKKRAAKKNKAEDDGLGDGDLSFIKQPDSTSLKNTFITNLPEFINDESADSINRNITEIIRNPPKVLQTIFNFLEIVDNSNAISTIGTIEFTDKLAKLNTVATVCNDEKEGTNLFNQLKETIKFEPLYKSPNTNTGGKTKKRNKGGKRKTMKLSKA